MNIVSKAMTKIFSYLRLDYAPMPPVIYLVVNSRCNLKCSMCDIGLGNSDSQFWNNMVSGKDMDVGLIMKIIKEVAPFKPLLAISSVEPLLYKPLPEIISAASKYGIKTQVTTNGVLLEEIAPKIMRAGLSRLFVSIDGKGPVHDSIRGLEGSFDRAMKGISRVNGLRKDYPLEELAVNCCLTPLNQYSLEELLLYLQEVPIDSVYLSHMNYVTSGMAFLHNSRFSHISTVSENCVGKINPSAMNIDALYEELGRIRNRDWHFSVNFIPELKTKEAVKLYYKSPEQAVAKSKCRIPWTQAQIKANGDLIVMTRCFPLILGNIGQTEFSRIWNGYDMRSFRKQLRRFGMFPACTRCCGVL